jgi:hypothetical protein
MQKGRLNSANVNRSKGRGDFFRKERTAKVLGRRRWGRARSEKKEEVGWMTIEVAAAKTIKVSATR